MHSLEFFTPKGELGNLYVSLWQIFVLWLESFGSSDYIFKLRDSWRTSSSPNGQPQFHHRKTTLWPLARLYGAKNIRVNVFLRTKVHEQMERKPIRKCQSVSIRNSLRFHFCSLRKLRCCVFTRDKSWANTAAGLATLIRWGQCKLIIDFNSLWRLPSGNFHISTKAARRRK